MSVYVIYLFYWKLLLATCYSTSNMCPILCSSLYVLGLDYICFAFKRFLAKAIEMDSKFFH